VYFISGNTGSEIDSVYLGAYGTEGTFLWLIRLKSKARLYTADLLHYINQNSTEGFEMKYETEGWTERYIDIQTCDLYECPDVWTGSQSNVLSTYVWSLY
jgi:hypothetical protein